MSRIITEARTLCESTLSNSICSIYHFHNLQHTIEVYKSSQLNAEAENITN